MQANVGIIEKWDPRAFARLLAMHQRESAALARAGAELIVWPESSYPYALARAGGFTRDFPLDDPRRVRRGFDTPLLFGAVTRARHPAGPAERYPYNTALMMDARRRRHRHARQGLPDAVRRVHPVLRPDPLVHEAVPRGVELQPRPIRRRSRCTPGPRRSKLGPLICYEDILPGFVRRVAKLGPNAFINITNDAWFGRTAEPYQHLALAVFRSVEHRLEMVRAVNTGVSAHIDAAGRVRAQTIRSTPTTSPRRRPRRSWSSWRCCRAAGSIATSATCSGSFPVAALIYFLARRGSGKRSAPARGSLTVDERPVVPGPNA